VSSNEVAALLLLLVTPLLGVYGRGDWRDALTRVLEGLAA